MNPASAAAIVDEIDRAFPDRNGMSLRPDHCANVETLLGVLERVPDDDLLVLPDATLEALAGSIDELRAYVGAWKSAGARERGVFGQPAFSVNPLDEVRAALAVAAAATPRQRNLASGLARLLSDFEELPKQAREERYAYFFRWEEQVVSWLKQQIGDPEAEAFSGTVSVSSEGMEDRAIAYLKALRNAIAKNPDKYVNAATSSCEADIDASGGTSGRLGIQDRDALREALLLRTYEQFGPDGSGSLERIAVEEALKRGGSRSDGIQALLYWNERGFLADLTHEGTATLSARGVDFVEERLRTARRQHHDEVATPRRARGIRVNLVLLVFTLGLLVGVYAQRSGWIAAILLAFVSNKAQFVAASVFAVLGGEVAGGQFDKFGTICVRRPTFWLALLSLLLGSFWVARLTLPQGSTVPSPQPSPTASAPQGRPQVRLQDSVLESAEPAHWRHARIPLA